LPFVLDSFRQVGLGSDLIVVEGAGSPAEINLRQGDIANMGFAKAADVPVILAGDIDRGGVIASIVGTHTVLDDEDRARIRGFIINKFRGDTRLFAEGLATIEALTGWPSMGVLPWFPRAHTLPAEDALDIASAKRDGAALKIVVPLLPRIANFDDLDPLKLDPSIDLRMISRGMPLPLDADLIIIPGSKSTIADLEFLRQQGWDIDIAAHVRRGGHVLGLCGGYQMLGTTIADPDGVEGPAGTAAGLGLLAVETILSNDKTVRAVTARHVASNLELDAYEIHLGITTGNDATHAPFCRHGEPEGAASANGRVIGTYLHGLFGADAFREAFLGSLKPDRPAMGFRYEPEIELSLNALADHIAKHLDTARLLEIARERL
jgi:adenosylcobyric acid synthase